MYSSLSLGRHIVPARLNVVQFAMDETIHLEGKFTFNCFILSFACNTQSFLLLMCKYLTVSPFNFNCAGSRNAPTGSRCVCRPVHSRVLHFGRYYITKTVIDILILGTIKFHISLGQTAFLRNKSIGTKSQSSLTDPEYIETNNNDLRRTVLRLSQSLIHPATSPSHPDTLSRRLVGLTTTGPPADSWDRNSAGKNNFKKISMS